MLSDDARCLLNTFSNVIRPAIERECGAKVLTAARLLERNLADLVEKAVEWEAATGPDAVARLTEAELPANVVALARKLDRKGVRVGEAARDVPPGNPWTFQHRTVAEVIADERGPNGGPAGGDAA